MKKRLQKLVEFLWGKCEQTFTEENARRFFRTQKTELMILGTMIGVATFIVKDAYRESLKDIVDNISAAQASFTGAQQFEAMNQHLESIEAKMSPESKDASSSIGEHLAHEYWSFYELERTELNDLGSLLKALPDQRDDLKTTYEDLEGAVEKMNQAYVEKERVITSKKPIVDNSERDYEEGQTVLVLELPNFVEELVVEAQEEKEARETKLKKATFASYVLYPASVLLAFAGRLFGADEKESSDDESSAA